MVKFFLFQHKQENDMAVNPTDSSVVDMQTGLNRKLIKAAADGDLELLKACIKCGADVNANVDIGRGNMAALHCASSRGKLEIVKELISSGANVDLEDNEGDHWRPIHYATLHLKWDVKDLLLKNGAKPIPHIPTDKSVNRRR
jgi:ankyrin repeat protein